MIESALKSSTSDEELDLVIFTMDNIIIEHLIEESVYSANECPEGMQDNHPVT